MNVLKSESGFAFIAAILAITVMVLGFMFASTRYYAALNEETARVQRILAAFEVVQNLAVEIRRGYDLQNVGVPSCTPPAAVFNINGQNYCLTNPVCVANPLGGLDTAAGGDEVCWDPTTFLGQIASSESEWKSKLYAGWHRARYLTGKQVIKVAAMLGNLSWAQTPDIHLPVIPATPPLNMTDLTCNVVPPGGDQEHCMRCDNDDWGNRARCVQIDVCLLFGGCPDQNSYIRQWIGMVR